MSKKISYLPVRTVVKFYENHDENNANKLFTKSLRKIGFIDKKWSESDHKETPEDHEFWLVDIVHETCSGEPKGCFILHPIRKVDADSLNRLLPGMYSEEDHNGCMILEPKVGGVNWLLPQRLYKQAMEDIYAIVVRQ